MKLHLRLFVVAAMLCSAAVVWTDVGLAGQRHRVRKHSHKAAKKNRSNEADASAAAPAIVGTQLRLSDGSAFVVDEAWEDGQGIWYRKNGVMQLLDRERVRAIERGEEAKAPAEVTANVVKISEPAGAKIQPVWIYLVGGARVEADDASESSEGVWYRRGPMSVFIEKARVERVERETDIAANAGEASPKRGWSTGNVRLDGMIKQSGGRHGVDPYLVFLVMEEESHFNPRVVSPKGARGLMQLMPGTGARFGVRHPFNPAENIEGGTRYLKQLLQRHNGRVDLVLASYNAGEGSVAKFGRVPPYHETQSYVRRISKRYGRAKMVQTTNQPIAAVARGGQ